MVVRGRQLVNQASARLTREGVKHGVMMAGHPGYREKEPIQVCSVDTLLARGTRPKADLIVIDEAHLATSEGYSRLLSHYDCPILSVTATPYVPMANIANVVIRPTTFDELVRDGYIVRPRYFAPSMPDLQGVHTANGEYVQSDLEKAVNKGNLIGDIVAHYKKYASDRKALCFAVTVNHSLQLAKTFNEAGIPARHVDADTLDHERVSALDDLEAGRLKVICNVGVMGLGVDAPPVDCIIMARPTKSEMLYIQQLGRGTRPYPGKKDFLVLDHSGNVLRHGFMEEEREACLKYVEHTKRTKSLTTCLNCFAVFSGSVCPDCSNSNPIKLRKIDVRDGDLVEMTPEMVRKDIDRTRKEKGYKLGWRYWEARRLYGEETAEKLFPKRFVPEWVKK